MCIHLSSFSSRSPLFPAILYLFSENLISVDR